MSELVTKSVAQEQQEQKIETRTAVEPIVGFTIVATAVAVLSVLIATAVYALDEYSLRSPERYRVLRLQGIRKLHRTSSRPIPKASQTVGTRAIRP